MDSTATVIGGGFYGCMLAAHLAEAGVRVILCEKHDDILGRASHANQARVHNGYHYPRSLLTALRSRANFPRFVREFAECIDDSFEKYYAIAARHSHVTARHFAGFCRRIGAPLRPAPDRIRRLFDPHHVESVFAVEEHAFDSTRLRQAIWSRLVDSGVEVRPGVEVRSLAQSPRRGIRVEVAAADGFETWHADRVFNCTYSGLNTVLARSGVPPIALKHEITELALVEMPEELADVGVTVMCGPFFSCMPFPSRGLHSLSHVRYTPHATWHDSGVASASDPDSLLAEFPRRSRFSLMVRDAARYLPAIAGARHVDSLWEVKTVPPANERDDGRPILLEEDVGMPGLTCVLASKIDNVFDMLDAVAVPGGRRRCAA